MNAHALILEDHPLAMARLTEVVSAVFPELVLLTAQTVQSALDQLQSKTRIQLALIDLQLPDGSGQRVLEALKAQQAEACAVICTTFADDRHLFPALAAGADGYLLKDQDVDSLKTMLRGIDEGKPPLSPAIARRLIRYFDKPAGPAPSNPSLDDESQVSLTPRESEVLTLIAKGLSAPRVADLLSLRPDTVSGYIKQIYRKLNISSRAEATLEATRRGLVR